MTGTFEFIDNSAIQGKSRKTIRSHVMKGKNAGKARPRHRQLVASQLERSMQIAQIEKTPWGGPKISIHLLSRLCNEMSSFSFPCVITPQAGVLFREFMRYVNESIYPPEFCLAVDALRTIWFQYILLDEAYFHCFMAMASACVGYAAGREPNTLGERHHIAKALELVNQRLSGDDAVSDINIAGVMALCILEAMKADAMHLKVHFDGLLRMIELRGGLEQLQHNYALVEKAHRIDIDLALRLGRSPHLRRLNRPTATILPASPKFTPRNGPFFDALQNVDLAVALEGREMMELASVLNSSTTMMKVDHFAFEDAVMSLCYKLIDICTIAGPRLEIPLSDAMHLAQIAFMSTMLVQFGFDCRFRYALLTKTYMAAMDHPGLLSSVDPATHFWLLVVGHVALLEAKDRPWLLHRVDAAIDQLQIRDWTGMSNLLRRYPWVNALHDRPAMELWNLHLDRRTPGRSDIRNETKVSTT